jgi:hypothetical protein
VVDGVPVAVTKTPHQLKEHWLSQAAERAGIDRSRWDPERGAEENRGVVEAVYAYYGRLYLDNPQLKWAGLAGMIGPAFYAAFRDLGFFPNLARRSVHAVSRRASRRLLREVGGNLGYYERTFLEMQKKIFEDAATMHEAYLAGGIPEIELLFRARIIDVATLTAWKQIDAGHRGDETALVDWGNRTLLFREQHDIIDRFYVQMIKHRPPLGPVFTYFMTLGGAPSVPGADSYPRRYPLKVVARLPRFAITLRTPAADGNIAMFANRWRLIDDDTLPDFFAFIQHHPDEARAMIATPVSKRARPLRLIARAGYLARRAIIGWRVTFSSKPPEPSPATRGGRLAARSEPAGAVLGLVTPPTREAVAGSDSRIWMDRRRRPFDVTVDLPGGRTFHAPAEKTAMLASARGGDPTRLTIQLPPGDAEATQQLIDEYAVAWGFPSDDVAGWRRGVQRRQASGDRDYSTHVFTPDDIGYVHLEFQVAHHVREQEFVVSALFSWGDEAGVTAAHARPTG